MRAINPMFHMDEDYMWRWFKTDAYGKLLCMSVQAFFKYEDARRDYDATQPQLDAVAA